MKNVVGDTEHGEGRDEAPRGPQMKGSRRNLSYSEVTRKKDNFTNPNLTGIRTKPP